MPDSFDRLQLLKDIESLDAPIEVKLDMLRDIARLAFPETSEIRKRLDNPPPSGDIEPQKLSPLIRSMIMLLPLYPPAPPVDAQKREKDIETEVRLSLNEKFTKSPYFLGMAAMLAACITLFSFGLVSLNKDIKSADEQVSKMQQQVTSATIAMNTMSANQEAAINKNQREFDDHIRTAESRIADAERSVASTIDTKFKQELDEVRRSKTDTVQAISSAGEQATTTINKTQGAIVDQMKNNTADRLGALKDAETDNLRKINQRGTELYFNLQRPTWKDLLLVGIKINWPLWIVSLLGLLLGSVAVLRH